MDSIPQMIYCSMPSSSIEGFWLILRLTATEVLTPRPEMGEGNEVQYNAIDSEELDGLAASHMTGLSCSSEPTIYNTDYTNIFITPKFRNAVPGWTYRARIVCRYYGAFMACDQPTCECVTDNAYRRTTTCDIEFEPATTDGELEPISLGGLSGESVQISAEVCQCRCE